MALASENVRRRLVELIGRAEAFVPANQRPDPTTRKEAVRFSAPRNELWRFLISSLQTVRGACGRKSPHMRELERCRESFVNEPDRGLDLDSCRGALEAARDDLDAGMLRDLRQLVTAEAFGDLLESAVYLLDQQHHIPAIAVTGAVLEASLRSLAKNKSVGWDGTSSISKINTALYTANIYDKVVWGEIEAWGKLRNKVDHGDFAIPADVDRGAGERMIDGVREFVARHR